MSSVNTNKYFGAVSDRLKIIDQKTSEKAEQIQKKRNSKYKHRPTTFNLGECLKTKTKSKSKSKASNRTTFAIYKRKTTIQKRCSSKKSKLKKCILKNRLLKQNVHSEETSNLPTSTSTFCEVTESLKNLTIETPKKNIHSRRFRAYCDNKTSKKLSNLVDSLLRKLDFFQKRAFQNNTFKGRSRRRLVIGLREVQGQIKINKIKCVVIATDCEPCEIEGGLDDLINNIKDDCHNENIPCVFALQRRELSYALFKKSPISCVGITNYDGAQDIYAEMLVELEAQKENYCRLIETKN